MHKRSFATVAAVFAALMLVACGHKQARVSVPSPPPLQSPDKTDQPPARPGAGRAEDSGNDTGDLSPARHKKPIYVETGIASWYGPPYHNRRGSDGSVYNMHAMTAAHRTLPLGTLVRVTNEKTGHEANLRITDRGPFIEGRILDLSLAAAKAVDVWQPGTARVKLEVLQAPVPLNSGGKWAVQIGGFEEEKSAGKFRAYLQRRYQTAKVLSFPSPTGAWWVRVRVENDDREEAQQIARNEHAPEGAVFLVRLD